VQSTLTPHTDGVFNLTRIRMKILGFKLLPNP